MDPDRFTISCFDSHWRILVMPEIRNPAPNDRFIIVYPQDFSFPWVFSIEVPSIAALIPYYLGSWWSPDLSTASKKPMSLARRACNRCHQKRLQKTCCKSSKRKGKSLPSIIFQGRLLGKTSGVHLRTTNRHFFSKRHRAVTHLKSLHWSEVKLPPKEVKNQALKFTTERMSFCTKRQFLGSSRWISGGVYNFSEAMN